MRLSSWSRSTQEQNTIYMLVIFKHLVYPEKLNDTYFTDSPVRVGIFKV